MASTTESLRGLNVPALDSWLSREAPGVQPPCRYSLLAGGHSNLTYRVEDAEGNCFALRRPPLGKLAARAHDVAREYRIYKAVGQTDVPVPEAVILCEYDSVIGAPFYLMRFVEGTVVDTPAEVASALPDADSRLLATDNLVDTLADLHRLNVDDIGLGDLGRREDYLARQLARMKGVWDKTKTRELPAIESQYQRLLELQPPQRYTGIVHSDYRLGNVMLDGGGQVVAVLDWELCALGDVVVDLAFLVNSWDGPEDPGPGAWMQDAPTRAGGFPDREALVTRYARRSGFDVSCLDYYRAFCYWRIAIIGEGIKRRYQSGALATDMDPDFVEARIQCRIDLTEEFLARAGGG